MAYLRRFPPTLLVCLILVGASKQQGTDSGTASANNFPATTVQTFADSTTKGPASADSATIGPVNADSTTKGPASADSATIGPVNADSTTKGPASADSATIGPVNADSTTKGPASADSTTIGPATTGIPFSEGTISLGFQGLGAIVPGGPVPPGALDSPPVLTALGPENRNVSGCCLDGWRYAHGCSVNISGVLNLCTNGDWILQGTTTLGG
ncbi:helicase SRCAP-like [Macrobrachium rosenbergii]|uniref:helicase SRCAP-like n=1 Tax=Macrobrachium rosenbergii TaxID=79674 RepID=UPI0034D70F9C